MSHDDDALIILSVEIPPELAECLDRKAEHGPFGANREEVAQFYLCNSFGVAVPAKPEQAAEEGGTEPGGTTPPDAAPDGGPQANDPGEGGEAPTTPGDGGQ